MALHRDCRDMACVAASGARPCGVMRRRCSLYGTVRILAEVNEHTVDGGRGRAVGPCGRLWAGCSGRKVTARECGAATNTGPDADDPDIRLSGAAGCAVRLWPCPGRVGQHDLCGPANGTQCDVGAARRTTGIARSIIHVRHHGLAALSVYRDALRQAPDSCRHQPAGAGQPVHGDYCCGHWRL